jgi:hypothetical protein
MPLKQALSVNIRSLSILDSFIPLSKTVKTDCDS